MFELQDVVHVIVQDGPPQGIPVSRVLLQNHSEFFRSRKSFTTSAAINGNEANIVDLTKDPVSKRAFLTIVDAMMRGTKLEFAEYKVHKKADATAPLPLSDTLESRELRAQEEKTASLWGTSEMQLVGLQSRPRQYVTPPLPYEAIPEIAVMAQILMMADLKHLCLQAINMENGPSVLLTITSSPGVAIILDNLDMPLVDRCLDMFEEALKLAPKDVSDWTMKIAKDPSGQYFKWMQRRLDKIFTQSKIEVRNRCNKLTHHCCQAWCDVVLTVVSSMANVLQPSPFSQPNVMDYLLKLMNVLPMEGVLQFIYVFVLNVSE